MSPSPRYKGRRSSTDKGFGFIYRDPSSQISGKDNSFFTRLPDCLALDSSLTDREFRLLALLHALWRARGGVNPIPFNVTSFAKAIGKSRQQTSRGLSALEDKGFISRATDTQSNRLVLFFKSFTTLYQNGLSKTFKPFYDGHVETVQKAPNKCKEITTPRCQETITPPECQEILTPDGCNEDTTAGVVKPLHPESGKCITSEQPNTEPSEPVVKRAGGERHDNSDVRAFKEDERGKKRKDSSLRSESRNAGALPSSASLRSASVFPDQDLTDENEGTSPPPDTAATPLPSPRRLPPKFSVDFDKDAVPEGEQIALFKDAKPKPEKKSPPEKKSSRNKGTGKKTKRKSGRRKTPEGGTAPGQITKIFYKRLETDYPNAPVSKKISGQDIGQLYEKVSGYAPEVVSKMVDVLFDDWTALQNKVWPKPTEGYPVLSHLWRYASTLATHIDTGIVDGSSRVSKHAIKSKGAKETYAVPDIKELYKRTYGSNDS